MQTIAVIGATGNMGRAISRSLAKGNYRLLLCARGSQGTSGLASEIKAGQPFPDVASMDCEANASWEADMDIMAVPFDAEKEIAEKIREMVNQKIVISTANPLNNSFDGLVTPPDTSAAGELQKLLPHAKVIKAFNNTFAADFITPVINGLQADAFIAGNDDEALQTVAGLVATAGFNPIIAGDLSVSRTLENIQLLRIQLGIKYNYNRPAGKFYTINPFLN